MKKQLTRIAGLTLCLALLLPLFTRPVEGAGGEVLLLPKTARNLAFSQSPELKSIANKITVKEIKYAEAVEILRAKEKNLRSFRWTPLLSFKFPQQLDMSQKFEFEMKPLQLQSEISDLKHQYNDLKYEVQSKVDKAYLECYITQEKQAFTQERLEWAETELARNRARLVTGEASQADVDNMQSNVESLRGELAQLMRNMASAKEKLGEITGMDVSYGYRFANPLRDLVIPREDLSLITQQALANDHTVFLAKSASAVALMNLNAYESIMRGKYGGKLSRIDNFLALAKSGQGDKIDTAAFRAEYDAMLKSMDAFWEPSITIIFFTFTMEWLKGELSGTRFIEDDLYALFAACFEYTDALKDQQSAEKALTSQVSALFEGLINARNAYLSLAKSLDYQARYLQRTVELNRLGRADYDEVASMRETYETMQLDTIDALLTYNELALEFNRTTCGALDPYFEGMRLGDHERGYGDSYAKYDPFTDPYYYLTTYVEDMVFEFGVSLPDGFEPAITHFELWFEGIRIGERTQVGTVLRHLTLDYGESTIARVRLYDGDRFVTECDIDTSILRGLLPITGSAPPATAPPRILGSFRIGTGISGNVSTVSLTFSPQPELGAAFYTLDRVGTGTLLTETPMPITTPFTYLGMLADELEDIRVHFYNKDNALIYTAKLDAKTMELVMVS